MPSELPEEGRPAPVAGRPLHASPIVSVPRCPMPKRTMPRRTAAAIATVAWLAAAGPAAAATFVVDSTVDEVDAAPGDGACATSGGFCALRAAVQEANALPGADTITLPAGAYLLARAGADEDGAALGDLDVSGDLAIAGAGAAATVIQACTVPQRPGNPCPPGQGVADRVLHVVAGITLSVSHVTIRHGLALSPSGMGSSNGGGIASSAGVLPAEPRGNLVLANVVVTNNAAARNGGGVHFPGPVTATDATLSHNTADEWGGGMLLASGGSLTRTTVEHNVAVLGGGIHVGGGSGTLEVTDSTIRFNTATLFGGGGVFANLPLRMTGSTVADNNAIDSLGGGINATEVVLTNSSVSGNTAQNCAGLQVGGVTSTFGNVTVTGNTANGDPGNGGGFCGAPRIGNSVVAGNRDLNGPDLFPDCWAQGPGPVSLGFNVLGDDSGCTGLVDGLGGDQVGGAAAPIDARLGPLADNGGPTLTHAPAHGSPALDAGDPAGCLDANGQSLATDQRGLPRPADGDGDGTVRCDAGSVEAQDATAAFTVSGIKPGAGGNGGPVTAMVYGSGFAPGMSVRLVRAGEPDVEGGPVATTGNGVVATSVFDLSGRPAGVWDLVATNPDGSSATLAAAFRVDPGGAPRVWADLVGRALIRPGRPARYLLMFGNRGNVDAHAVPVGISFPKAFGYSLEFAVAPPPPRAGQVPTDWPEVGGDADTGPASDVRSITLLIPVVPAGFTGALELTLTTAAAGPFELTFGAGSPYYEPELNPRVVNAFVEGALSYAERSFGSTTFRPRAELEAYVTGQLQTVVSLGSEDLVASLGTAPRVHSLAHLLIDLARFAAVFPE